MVQKKVRKFLLRNSYFGITEQIRFFDIIYTPAFLLCKCFDSGQLQIWLPATLVSLEIQGHVLPFRKPPIKICMEPACQVGSSILKVRQAILKS